jgi:hypothetical protein
MFSSPEADFEAVFGRVREQGLQYRADPRRCRPGEIITTTAEAGSIFLTPTATIWK